ncbi:MAG: beta-galactosidase [Victivallaceae bacterium]|nr:beta-galactosidase [Victivallaceae bacterium]
MAVPKQFLLIWTLLVAFSTLAQLPTPLSEQDKLHGKGIGRWQKEGAFFEVIERLPGGEIHLKDTSTGKSNETLRFHFSGRELAFAAGKKVRFSAKIKLIAGRCSLGFWGQSREKRFFGATECKGASFEDARLYSVVAEIPKDAISFCFNISCAGGFGNTGEAVFSDLRFEVVKEKDPPCEAALAKEDASAEGTKFWLFQDAPLPHYAFAAGHSPLVAENISEAYRGKGAFRLVANKDCTARDRILFQSIAHNRGYDLEHFMRGNGFVEFYFRPSVRLAVSWHELGSQHLAPAKNGWTRCRIPLKELRDKIDWKRFYCLVLSFPGGLKKGEQVEIDELAIVSPRVEPAPKAVFPDSKTKQIFESCLLELNEPLAPEVGSRKIPEIKNGTYYLDNRPVFLLGPFFDNLTMSRDFRSHAKRPVMGNRDWYWNVFDQATAKKLGFNSIQLSSAQCIPMELLLKFPIRVSPVSFAMEKPFFTGLGSMPAVMDFAWIYITAVELRDEKSMPPEVFQQNTDWHQFIPFCPEHPMGDRIMSEHYRLGTALALRRNLNVYCYELFNEGSYDCRCRFNRKNFAEYLAGKFHTVKAANQAWKTHFKSFAEAVQEGRRFEKNAGLWVEWCKFSGDHYVELFRKYKAIVRKEDPSPKILFGEQRGSALATRELAKDYTKLTPELDVLATESGYKFGSVSAKASGKVREAEEAAHSAGYRYALETDTLAALVKRPDQVLANHEHYCIRMENAKRAPSRKSDIVTAMWMEVFHDLSASYVFNWGSAAPKWRTWEDARKLALAGGANSAYLLNPYAYPPESLEGFRAFLDELEPLRELALPMPRRRQASIALLHSLPTLRLSILPPQRDYVANMLKYYGMLATMHYPFEMLFEEDATPEKLAKYQMVIAPDLRNSYPGTVPALLQYVRKGGHLLLGTPDSGKYDEYNQSRPLDLSGAQMQSCFAVFPRGKGKIYRVVREGNLTKAALKKILEDNQILRHVCVEAFDHKELDNTTARMIDRKDAKFVCVVNWNDDSVRLVRVRFFGVGAGQWRVMDPVTKERIVNSKSSSGDWSQSDLEEGVPVMLLAQNRSLLLATRNQTVFAPSGKVSSEEIRNRFEAQLKAEAKDRLRQLEQQAAARNAYLEARRYRDVAIGKCEVVNLKKAVSSSFDDVIAGDGRGGWFDQGVNDFRKITFGRQILGNVPFEIIDPAQNDGRGVLILKGRARPNYPAERKNIVLSGKAKCLYFMHTAGWQQPVGSRVYFAVLHYADSSKVAIEINYGQDISDWWRPEELPGAKIAMEKHNAQCERIGFYICRKYNPHPEKELRGMDLVSANSGAVPAVAAITLERP